MYKKKKKPEANGDRWEQDGKKRRTGMINNISWQWCFWVNLILFNTHTDTGYRKSRRTRDQIADIHWIIENAREFQKNIYFCFIDYAKAFDCVDHNKLENSWRDGNTRPPDLPPEKSLWRSTSNSQNWTWNNRLVPNRKRSTSRLYIVTLLI